MIDRIYIDTREKPQAIKKIIDYFNRNGVETIHQKLDVGDYMVSPDAKLSVDRKMSLIEVCGNLAQQHKRFTAECIRAQENGIKLIILVEHGGAIRSIEDVKNWVNPRLKVSPYAISGERLYRLMLTYSDKYGVEWRFCDKRATGRVIVELLGGNKK